MPREGAVKEVLERFFCRRKPVASAGSSIMLVDVNSIRRRGSGIITK
jgi:hypothetical protein